MTDEDDPFAPPPRKLKTAKGIRRPTIGGMAQINRDLETLEKQHLDAMAVLNAQNAQKIQKDMDTKADAIRSKWQGILQPIAQAWGQSLQAMIQGTQNLRRMMQSIGNAILQEAIGWIEKVAVRFVLGENLKTGAAVAGAAERGTVDAAAAAQSVAVSALATFKQFAHSAALAAARTYAAIAAIPVIGPYLAPAAAALVAVVKFGQAVFSAEDGAGDVPYDNAPFVLHKREMVLPAPIADTIRAMSTSGVKPMSMPLAAPRAANSNFDPPAAANQSTVTHKHYYTIQAMDGQDVERVLMRHATKVAKATDHAIRQGYKPKYSPI